MPQLSDLVEKRKFVKKEYRPWDLSGTGTVDGKEKYEEVKSEATASINKCDLSEEKSALIKHTITESIDVQITTDNKSGNNIGNNQVTIEQQRDNIKVTETKQRDNIQITNKEHRGNIIDNVTDNTGGFSYLIDSIKKLAGIQKNIFLHVVNVCSARGELDTGTIISIDLANVANCSIGSAKTSLIRLVEKRLVLRLRGKASRGGHMVLGITKEIQAAAIQVQQAFFNPLKMPHPGNIKGNVTGNIDPYSSSIYKNNITTSLPDEWKKINFELLRHIGFSETQLCQLHNSNATTPEIVQDAINRFSYSLEHNDKVKAYSDPLNVLMGVLRKGQRWIEANYLPLKEIALRQLLEEKRKQKEERDAMIKELIDLEFPNWRRKLTPEEVHQIVPAEILKSNIAPAITVFLRTYFTENIILPKLNLDDK